MIDFADLTAKLNSSNWEQECSEVELSKEQWAELGQRIADTSVQSSEITSTLERFFRLAASKGFLFIADESKPIMQRLYGSVKDSGRKVSRSSV